MDALTVFFIVFFGIAALIPATWSIIGLIRGDTRFWPGVVGTVWALGLLTATFIGIATKWGGCPPGSATSDGAVKCYRRVGDSEPTCKPDVWRLNCGPRPTCGDRTAVPPVVPVAIPANQFCPTGQIAIFPFCEPIKPGEDRVMQPWATWSDLAFVAAGLWLLWWLHFYERSETLRMAGNPPVDNPMLMIGWLSVVYGMIVIFMGPPSQWYHASMKDWAGWFDAMSVVIWLMFSAVYVIYMLARTMWDKGRRTERTILVLSIWFLLVIIAGFIAIVPDARTPLYFAGGVPWGIAEVAYLICGYKCDGVKFRRHPGWFIANFLLLAGTMVLWGFFNDGIVKTDCLGRAGFPGHALFHILASFATILTFFSFASERRVTS